MSSPKVRPDLDFLLDLLVGETIKEISSIPDGVLVKMESGLVVSARRTLRTDLGGEKITGLEKQFAKTPNVITLNFASGRRAVIII